MPSVSGPTGLLHIHLKTTAHVAIAAWTVPISPLQPIQRPKLRLQLSITNAPEPSTCSKYSRYYTIWSYGACNLSQSLSVFSEIWRRRRQRSFLPAGKLAGKPTFRQVPQTSILLLDKNQLSTKNLNTKCWILSYSITTQNLWAIRLLVKILWISSSIYFSCELLVHTL